MSWTAILILAGGAYFFKAAGVLIGTRVTNKLLQRAVRLIPPALFCALVALQTFERDGELAIDARVVGCVVAAVATWRKVPFIGVLLLAMAATAATRFVA